MASAAEIKAAKLKVPKRGTPEHATWLREQCKLSNLGCVRKDIHWVIEGEELVLRWKHPPARMEGWR